jgi:hypothetical protein
VANVPDTVVTIAAKTAVHLTKVAVLCIVASSTGCVVETTLREWQADSHALRMN